ncbi:MAG: hypothetical protein ACHQPH_27685, partial [Reyranellales bacterium]
MSDDLTASTLSPPTVSLGFDGVDSGATAGSSSAGEGLTSAVIPREEYAALERCVYLNQASLG